MHDSKYLDVINKFFEPVLLVFVMNPYLFAIWKKIWRKNNFFLRLTKCAGHVDTPSANGRSGLSGHYRVCGSTQMDAHGQCWRLFCVRPLEIPLSLQREIAVLP
jgi:hypothetical protein